MKKILTIWILILVFASCEEKTEWDLSTRPTDYIVVDGVFSNEGINHLIKLSKTNVQSNDGFSPASGAFVAITDGTNSHILTEFPVNSGLYFTDNTVRAVVGRAYTLFIQYEGNEYVGSDRAEPVQPMGPLIYEKSDSLYQINFQSARGGDPSMTRHFMNWEHTNFCSTSGDICIAKVIDYDVQTVDVNEIFPPDKEDVVVPAGTVVLRKKYSMSTPYRVFLRGMLSETEWRGGLFDVQRGNVPTNMSEGALGFFAVAMVVSDTTLIVPIQ